MKTRSSGTRPLPSSPGVCILPQCSRASRRVLSVKIPLADRKDALTALGFIPDEAAAMAMVAVAEAGPDDTKTLAQWWLQNRSEHVWKSYRQPDEGFE